MAHQVKPVLSVVIPLYNEQDTILKLLQQVLAVEIVKEIVVVDDASRDESPTKVAAFIESFKPDKWNLGMRLLTHPINQGKGAAIRDGFAASTGEILLVQDADLEYDPQDYHALIEPIQSGKTRVMYGSRRLLLTNKQHSAVSFYFGGILITWFTNILFGSHLTDEPTCYKVFHEDALKGVAITENRFGWEPEITAKLLRRGETIAEVPIHYYPRPVEEGKKIKWQDGVEALWLLLKYRIVK